MNYTLHPGFVWTLNFPYCAFWSISRWETITPYATAISSKSIALQKMTVHDPLFSITFDKLHTHTDAKYQLLAFAEKFFKGPSQSKSLQKWLCYNYKI